jgi:hypothetical protein
MDKTAPIVLQRYLCSRNPPLARLTSQLPYQFCKFRNAGGPNDVPFGQQSTAGIDRNLAPDVGATLLDEPATFALGTKPKVFIMDDLRRAEAIVHLPQTSDGGAVRTKAPSQRARDFHYEKIYQGNGFAN